MSPRCFRCDVLIVSGEPFARARSDFVDQVFNFHHKCFECAKCSTALSENNAIVPYKARHLLCFADYEETSKSASTCRGCGRKCFDDADVVSGETYHPDPDCKPVYTTLAPVRLHRVQDLSPPSSSHSFTSDGSGLVDESVHVLPDVPLEQQAGPQLATLEGTYQAMAYNQYYANYFPTTMYPENNYLMHHYQQQQYMLAYQAQINQQKAFVPGSEQNHPEHFLPYRHQVQQNQPFQRLHHNEEQYYLQTPSYAENPLLTPLSPAVENTPPVSEAANNFSGFQEPKYEYSQQPENPMINSETSSIQRQSQPQQQQAGKQHQHDLKRKWLKSDGSDSPKSHRNRSSITMSQKVLLEEVWRRTSFPSREERISLAIRTELRPRQVQIWFQNMRSKGKREGPSSTGLNDAK